MNWFILRWCIWDSSMRGGAWSIFRYRLPSTCVKSFALHWSKHLKDFDPKLLKP